MMIRCKLCPEDEAFAVPFDSIGTELMKAHLYEKHGISQREDLDD